MLIANTLVLIGSSLCELAKCFLAWVDDARLEEKIKKCYRNGVGGTPVGKLAKSLKPGGSIVVYGMQSGARMG